MCCGSFFETIPWDNGDRVKMAIMGKYLLRLRNVRHLLLCLMSFLMLAQNIYAGQGLVAPSEMKAAAETVMIAQNMQAMPCVTEHGCQPESPYQGHISADHSCCVVVCVMCLVNPSYAFDFWPGMAETVSVLRDKRFQSQHYAPPVPPPMG